MKNPKSSLGDPMKNFPHNSLKWKKEKDELFKFT